jgi:hypothetical protein
LRNVSLSLEVEKVEVRRGTERQENVLIKTLIIDRKQNVGKKGGRVIGLWEGSFVDEDWQRLTKFCRNSSCSGRLHARGE